MTKMNRNTMIALVAVVVILGVGAFVYKNRDNDGEKMDDNSTQSYATPAASAVASPSNSLMATGSATTGVREFTVSGSNFKFEPSQLKVKKGDTVKITFKNSGGFHDFVIDEFKVKTKQIASGASETITFVADKAGAFEYYCSVGQHRQMGMKGSLIVE